MSINNSNFNFLKTGAQTTNTKSVQEKNDNEILQNEQKTQNTKVNDIEQHQTLVTEHDIWEFLSTSAISVHPNINKSEAKGSELATGATTASMQNLSNIKVSTSGNGTKLTNGDISFVVDSSYNYITRDGSKIKIQNKLTGTSQSSTFQDAINHLKVTKVTCKNNQVIDLTCGDFKGAKVSWSQKDLEWKISKVDENRVTHIYSLDIATGKTELISKIAGDGTVLYSTRQAQEKPTFEILTDSVFSKNGKTYRLDENTVASIETSSDGDILVLTKKVGGFTEIYKYDANDVKRFHSKIEDSTGKGNETVFGIDGKEISSTFFAQDETQKCDKKVYDANGKLISSSYVDENNNTIEYTYDSKEELASGKKISSQGSVLEEWSYDGYKESHQTISDGERHFGYAVPDIPTPQIKYNSAGQIQSLMYYKDDQHLMSADGNLLKVSLPYRTGQDCYIRLTDEQLSNMTLDKMISFYSDIKKITSNICSSHKASVQLGEAKKYKDEIFAKVNEYFVKYFNNEHPVIMTNSSSYAPANNDTSYSSAKLMLDDGTTVDLNGTGFNAKINNNGTITCTKTVKNKIQNRVETKVYNTKGLVEQSFVTKTGISQKHYDNNGNLTSELNISKQKYPYIANIKTYTDDKEKAYNDFVEIYNTVKTSLSNLDWRITINKSKVEINPENYDSLEQLATACGFENLLNDNEVDSTESTGQPESTPVTTSTPTSVATPTSTPVTPSTTTTVATPTTMPVTPSTSTVETPATPSSQTTQRNEGITQNGKVFTNVAGKTFDYSKISPINNGYQPTVYDNKLVFTKTVGNMTYTYTLNENFEFTKYITSNKSGSTIEYTYTNGSNINGARERSKEINNKGIVTYEKNILENNQKYFINRTADGKLSSSSVYDSKNTRLGYVNYAAKSVTLNVKGTQRTFTLSNISQTGEEITGDILIQLADFAATNSNKDAINNKLKELLEAKNTPAPQTTTTTPTKTTGTQTVQNAQTVATQTTTTEKVTVESVNANNKASATKTVTKDKNGNMIEEKVVASNGVVVESTITIDNNPNEQCYAARDFVTGELEEVALSTPEGSSAINVHYGSSTIAFYVNGQAYKFTNTSAIRGNSKTPTGSDLKALYEKVADLVGTQTPQQISYSNKSTQIASLINTYFKSLVLTTKNTPAPATITITPISRTGSGVGRSVLK